MRDNDRHNLGDVHASGPLAGIPYIPAEYRLRDLGSRHNQLLS